MCATLLLSIVNTASTRSDLLEKKESAECISLYSGIYEPAYLHLNYIEASSSVNYLMLGAAVTAAEDALINVGYLVNKEKLNVLIDTGDLSETMHAEQNYIVVSKGMALSTNYSVEELTAFLLHEYGHIFKQDTVNTSCLSKLDKHNREYKADEFAKAIGPSINGTPAIVTGLLKLKTEKTTTDTHPSILQRVRNLN